MSDQLTNNPNALRLFFTEDIYLTKEEKPEPEKVNSETGFSFLGKNQKNILILVNDEHNAVSTVQGGELLRKIVKAIGLSGNDFALVNYASCRTADFEEFLSFFSCKLLLAFGVSPADLHLPGSAQNVITAYGSVRMIFSSDLQLLNEDQQGKKELWSCLKVLKI